MANIKAVACGNNYISARAAAAKVFQGCVVIRSAAGTVTRAVDGSNTKCIDGVALDNKAEKATQIGYYATYDPVSVVQDGVVRVWVTGGGTDIAAGNFLKLDGDLGCCQLDSATTAAASTTIARAIEDQEISDYTTSLTTATAGSKSVTVASTANIAAGDFVLLNGAGYAVTDSEIAIVDTVDSSTTLTLKEAATFDQSSTNLRILKQVTCVLW